MLSGFWEELASRGDSKASKDLDQDSEDESTGTNIAHKDDVLPNEDSKPLIEKQKKLSSDPDGNLYRGWAVAIPQGNRQLFFTGLVMFVQCLGPMMMCQWAWSFIAQKGMPKVPYDLTSLFQAWAELSAWEVQMKMLNIALLLIIYTNADQILDRMDRQTDRLRELYPRLSRRWMVIDAFCNSWCVVLCSIAAPAMFWSADDVKDIILDAFGLLFLYNLDEYSSDLEYGIETSDFDDIIEERARLMGRRHLLKDKPNLSDDEERWEEHEGEVMYNQCFFGDFMFSFARFINFWAMCFAVPAFVAIEWPSEAEPTHTSMEVFWHVFTAHAFLPSISIFVILVTYLFRTRTWLRQPHTFSHDCYGFLYCVIFLRKEDPRQVSYSGSMNPESEVLNQDV